MGIFKSIKKVFNPGGVVVSKIAGDGHDYKGVLDYAMNGKKNGQQPPPAPFDPGQRVGSSINGQSGVDQPSMRLGWTNGGYTYHNSPFNMQPHNAPAPQPMPQNPAPPMAFGGGNMGMSGPGPMLQVGPGGGSMPSAGAPGPQAAPTAPNPEMMRAIMVRNRGMMS